MIKTKTVSRVLVFLFMGLFALIFIFPFYAMIMMSTYSTAQLFRGLRLVPGDHFATNVRTLLNTVNFYRMYLNSLYLAIVGPALSVFVSAMGGYALGVYNFKGKKILMGLILTTLMIPGQIAIVGIVMQAFAMGIGDTHLHLILLGIPSAFGIFWMASFSKQSIPNSVLESAFIDGSSDFNTFIRIGLPFLRPACGTLFLLAFLGSWNSFLMPTILLSTPELFTLPIGIRLLANTFGTDIGAQLAGLVLGTFPILFVLTFFSKTLIQGLSASAVKE